MSEGTEDFFEGAIRTGAPSAKLSDINDGVIGEIVDQFKVDKKKFASDEIEKDSKTGEPIKQLVVVLQTSLRNWTGVAKIPRVDATDKNSPEKDPSEDDGRRAVYVAPYTNIFYAVGEATAKHNGGRPTGLRNGAKFGVKVVNLEDVGKGNPKKVHQAVYEPPAASDDGFFGNQAQQAPPQQQSQPAPQQAPPAQDPWQSQGQSAPPQQQSQPAPQQQDPWGTGTTNQSDGPPF